MIGGGVIGLGARPSVYKRLGAEVTVVEYLDRIIPTMDAGSLQGTDQGLEKSKNLKSRSLTRSKRSAEKVTKLVVLADDKKGNEVEIKGDYCLVSVGRRPYTDGLQVLMLPESIAK